MRATRRSSRATLLVTVRALADSNVALFIYDIGTEWVETASRVAVDAWGIATSPDGRFAAITSAWSAKVRWSTSPPAKSRGRDVPASRAAYLHPTATASTSPIWSAPRIDGVTGDAKE
jgi:hypothetical protein